MTSLPCDKCKGLCCSYAPMSRREFKTIRKKYGIPRGATLQNLGEGTMVFAPNAKQGECAFLKNGRCSVWEDRPTVCRLYGEIPQLPCAYLYPEKVGRMVDAHLDRLGVLGLSLTGRSRFQDTLSRNLDLNHCGTPVMLDSPT